MMYSVMLCWYVISIVHHSSALLHGGLQLDSSQISHRRIEPAFISEIGKTQSSRADPAFLEANSVEEQLMMDAESYDEEASQEMSEAMRLQSRTIRSPRRCIPHQQSCLGHQLPCCDPCDTCYCRFFNAICYCRRVGHSCRHRRT